MENIELEQQIDAYLTGQLTEAESKAFEASLATDQGLRSEVEFQKNLISEIRNYRSAQLKSRLDQVKLPGSDFEAFLQSNGAKILYGSAIAVAGVGLFWFATPKEEVVPQPEQQKVELLAETNDQRVEEVLPMEQKEQVQPEEPFEESAPDLEEEDETSVPADESRLVKESVTMEKTEEMDSEGEPEATQSFTPDISLPADDFEPDDQDFESNENTPGSMENPVTLGASMINIEVVGESRTRSFKYFDGKLSLYGDFSESTYEIIEINTDGGREVFFYYAGSYYQIILTRVTIPLKPISDPAKIQELETLRAQ